MTPMADSNLMSREEAAEVLGVAPESVRHVLRRYGITEERGYPRNQVLALKRKGRGHRTDLRKEND